MWMEPKADWTDSDYFNLSDYNRIKNNLDELRTMAIQVIPEFEIQNMGDDLEDYNHIWDITEINRIEDNLQTIFQETNYPISIGSKTTYYYNQPFIQYSELNRIESATLQIYNRLYGQIHGRKMLEFRLGGGAF